MSEKKERKNNLITFRITDDDGDTLDYLSDCMGSSVSDTLIRACRFFLNMGDTPANNRDTVTDKKKERKTRQVHLRVTDSDMDQINARREKFGETPSQIFRKSIKAYDRFKRNHY